MPELTNITRYYPEKKGKPQVLISVHAEARVLDLAQQRNLSLGAEEARRFVAISLHDFMRSPYMRGSLWFKTRELHTFTGLQLLDPATREPLADTRLLVKHTDRGLVILAPGEEQLPENYYDQRVIEESKILYADFLK